MWADADVSATACGAQWDQRWYIAGVVRVQHGLVLCGTVWYCVVLCSTVWCCVMMRGARCGTARRGAVWCGEVRCGLHSSESQSYKALPCYR